MAIDLDDEILQDFLVEAGEILELLSEQLVELEQSPEDFELLNAIFRGFHTIKGGAGFLAINPLVDVCHSAEDVFNVLRQGERKVNAELMDVILQVVDVVNEMFGQVRSGNDPTPAADSLLQRLRSFTSAEEMTEEAAESTDDTPAEPSVGIAEPGSDIVEQEFESMLVVPDDDGVAKFGGASDEITEDEFEELLDALHGKGGSPTPKQPNQSDQQATGSADEISEEEFERLLDDLHGKGKFSSKNLSEAAVKKDSEDTPATDSGDITEEEFEQLLDELHGKGKFKGANVQPTPSQESEEREKTLTEATEQGQAEIKPQTEAMPVQPKKTEVGGKEAKRTAKTMPPQGDTTVRVDTQVLDEIMNMVGELVLVRNRFQTLKANEEAGEQFAKAVSNLDVVTADLQLSVMKTRMQPIKKVFGRFPRVVRDLARSLNKEIRLELVGEETDLDKNLVEALADPLVHLVRNAVDHGIEAPEERVAKGKPREGLVVLTASQEGDHILLSIKDDGKGMNADTLRAKVIEKGLMDEESAARLDDKECYNLIFLPGFSTKSEISDVSGRGVGMDVVKTRITQMNGVVEIDSEEGAGSTIIIKVPLTLAIMPTLMVKLGGQAFALPLASVVEILDLDLRKTNVVDGQLVVVVRQKALPLFYLGEWLVQDPHYVIDKHAMAHVVVVNAGGRQVGFVVDQLIGQEEVVIKPLGAKLQGLEGLAGGTITGDGKIALILDVPGLMKRYAG
ncbi:chemotaxis protein CheA [Methylomarinum vadi]|uniref:chemotaxis protein CheA n=1 Tax=Methylomarinum vadi TaxID=438855 RepID=UPI0004DF8218|nr:chemotaxis protein CheA [Methylomarinum vadi]